MKVIHVTATCPNCYSDFFRIYEETAWKAVNDLLNTREAVSVETFIECTNCDKEYKARLKLFGEILRKRKCETCGGDWPEDGGGR